MIEKGLNNIKFYSNFAVILLLIAVLLYLIGFWRGESFFLDELNVARNIAEKRYWELFFPLKYEQYAPPLFAQMVKGSATIFGYSEFGLRLIPLVASLSSLLMFYALLRCFFNNWVLLYPLILFIFNFYLYQQGLSLKQYSMDVLLTTGWLFLAIKYSNPNLKNLGLFAIFGSVSVWLSMPIVFVLTGVGMYFLYQKWNLWRLESTAEAISKSFFPLFLMIGAWLVSFGILFWVNLRHGIQTSGLQDYHTTYFLELPTSFAKVEQSSGLIIGIFRAIVGKTALAIGWAMLCFAMGIFHLWKKEKALLILLILPIVSCFFASVLHYYSLIIRLVLFLFPSLILIMGFGCVFLIEKIDFTNKLRRWIAFGLVVFCMIFSSIHRNALPYLFEKYIRANPRLILEKIAETDEATLPLYATHFGVPAYDFYTKYYETPIVIDSKTVIYGYWEDDLLVLANGWKRQGIERIWIFDNHTFGEEKLKMDANIQKIGVVEIHFKDVFAEAFLVKLQ